MKTKKLLFYLLAALLGGCIPVMSLHPLYTEKDVVFEAKLLGTWVDNPNSPETVWQFSDANKQEKKYKFTFADKDGQKGLFVAHLVKLQNRLFMDVYPSEPPWNEEDPNKVEWSYNTLFFIPSHTFIKINSLQPELKLQLTDDDELKKLFEEKPNAIEHISIEDKLILTASTQKLQAFVLKYADDSRVFTAETVLTPKKPKSPQLPPEKDPNEVPKGK
jgi:hypothetical protein